MNGQLQALDARTPGQWCAEFFTAPAEQDEYAATELVDRAAGGGPRTPAVIETSRSAVTTAPQTTHSRTTEDKA